MSGDNGQKGFINENEIYLNEGNTLSFGQDTATVFYQEKPYFTGDKIKILKCKYEQFGKNNAHFFVTAIARSFTSFSWGTSSYSIDAIENQIIKLPIKNNQIDFDFMESFIAELEAVRVAELSAYLKISGLDNCELSGREEQVLRSFENIEWREFRIGALFEKIKTKKLPYRAEELPSRITGNYTLPCLTSSFRNQGLNYFAPKDGATILKDVISIPSNSDVYRAYFQSNEFTVLSDAYAIRWISNDTKLLPVQYLFIVSCINKVTNLPVYSYKNKLGGWNVVKDKFIQLPVKHDKPDYEIMETFISAIQKLVIKDVVSFTANKINATKKVIAKD